jgi:hypothetical protein
MTGAELPAMSPRGPFNAVRIVVFDAFVIVRHQSVLIHKLVPLFHFLERYGTSKKFEE